MAVGSTATGQREVLGIEVGDSEAEAFWTAFLRRLRKRGLSALSSQLSGVKLVNSDAHAGLKKAIARCCQGTTRQHCPVDEQALSREIRGLLSLLRWEDSQQT